MSVILVRKRFVGDATLDSINLWVIPIAVKFEERRHYFDFLLDTGAQRTVLTPWVKQIMKLEVSIDGSTLAVSATGHSRYAETTISLEIGAINIIDTDVLVGSLPELFRDYEIAGILGADVLKLLFLKINYLEKLLEIERPVTFI